MSVITDPAKIRALLAHMPTLEAQVANLRISLQVAYKRGTGIIAEPEEIMEAMALLNVISDMPHGSPSPGDKMNNVIDGYQKILDTEFNDLCREINNKIFVFDKVIERIENGMKKLPDEQRDIINLKYWKSRTWKQIQDTTRLSKDQYKFYHRAGIEALGKMAEIDAESYEFCMEQLKGGRESEGNTDTV